MNSSDLRIEPERREFWFESDGVRLYVVDHGQRQVLVFLHGGLADHRSALFRTLPVARSLRLLTPDLRGAGRSVYAGKLSWDLWARDVLRLLDHVGVERALVGGVSAGSAVALRFALRYPQRTRGLVLMAPVYAGRDRGFTPAQLAAFGVMAEAGERTMVLGVEALRPLYAQLPEAIRERALEMMLGFDAASVAATLRFLTSGAQPFDSVTELRAIEAPVLLVSGTDAQHPPEVTELYAQHLKRHSLVDPLRPDLAEELARLCQNLD